MFHQHANSELQNPTDDYLFPAVNHNYSKNQQTAKNFFDQDGQDL